MFLAINYTVTYENNLNELKKTGIKTYGTIIGSSAGLSGITMSGGKIQPTTRVTFLTEDGTEIEVVFEHYNALDKKGKQVELYYDPLNPSKAMLKESGIFYFLIIGTPSLPIIIWIVIFARKLFFSMHGKYLVSRGFSVMADIIKVSKNSSVKLGDNHPHVIHARGKIGGSIYDFKSRTLWYDPSTYLKDKIQVFVDYYNYNKYYIDTDFPSHKNKTVNTGVNDIIGLFTEYRKR
jgi:hypothetical protein